MPRRSSILSLPKEAQSKIVALHEAGSTLDDILDAVTALLESLDGTWKPPSRSAIHRHLQGFEETAARMREAREMAEALGKEITEVADDKTAGLLVDMMRTIIFKVLQDKVASGEDFDPKDFAFMGKALKDVASASSIGTKQAQDIREQARLEAAEAVQKEAKSRGFDRQTIKTFYDIASGKVG